MKIGAIIQARVGSSRLPNKVMMDLFGKSVLNHVITRLKQSNLLDEIIIATTTNVSDNIIINEAISLGVKSFRGSELNVLERYYITAIHHSLDVVVRITSDCPLIDPRILDKMISFYSRNTFDIITNGGTDALQRTFPRGLDIEIFSFNSLREAYLNATKPYQLEHVTPYLYENSNNAYFYKNRINLSHHRWTLDTQEDWDFIYKVYTFLYHGNHNFYMKDILKLLSKHKYLTEINSHIEQKRINK